MINLAMHAEGLIDCSQQAVKYPKETTNYEG
jgi:hypothetical protein